MAVLPKRCLALSLTAAVSTAFLAPSPSSIAIHHSFARQSLLTGKPAAPKAAAPLFAGLKNTNDDEIRRPSITAAPLEPDTVSIDPKPENTDADATPETAATNTVNARLQAELQAAAEAEKSGNKSRLGKKISKAFKSEKSDAERKRSIEEAQNLNGVNPLVAGGSGLLAFGMSFALWTATTFIGDEFVKNPVNQDVYTIARLSGVFRNVVMGLFSLASGFAGVIGLGLVLLGGRVAYGVATGELDPTPIKKGRGEELVMPNVMDLMMGKKPGRKGRKNGTDDNPFDL